MKLSYNLTWLVRIGLVAGIIFTGAHLLSMGNPNFFGPFSTSVIVATCAISWSAFRRAKIADDLVFFGPAIEFRREWHRFLSYGFVHADFWHLAFNMFTLWSFGAAAEQYFAYDFGSNGRFLYALFYASALVVSIWPTFVKHRRDSAYVSLGASGAVSAVLSYVVLTDPSVGVYVYFIPMPGWAFLVLFISISIYLGKRPGSRINHNAHVVGSIYGLLCAMLTGYLAGVNLVSNFISYLI